VARWTHDRVVEYLRERFGERGAVLFLSEYHILAWPAGSNELVYVNLEDRECRSGTFEELIAEYEGAEEVRVVGCGERHGYVCCDVEMVFPGGHRERRSICNVI